MSLIVRCEYLPDDSEDWLPYEVPHDIRGRGFSSVCVHMEAMGMRTGLPTRIFWKVGNRGELACRVYFPDGRWMCHEELAGREYWGDLRHPDPDHIPGVMTREDIPF